ncbi:MAG TPA: PaaI family thioesterase [Lachnospiraceae bacterium]|nr:PaaI family thioesterase [Lachnospiraceae bacterium]
MKWNCEEINERFAKENGYVKKNRIEITDVSEGYAKGRIELELSDNNPFGYVHGGCLFTLADTVGGIAAMTYGQMVTTISAQVHYLNQARDTKYIEARTKEIKNGRTTSIYEVEITDQMNKTIAMFTLTYFKLV